MTIFGRFNSFEIFFAVLIFFGLISHREKSKGLITLSVMLIGLSLFYKFYMTPLIADTSIKIHQIAATDPQYQILEAQHNYFHALYRSFDTAKLLILLVFAGLITRLNIKKLHKESV